MQQYGLLSGSPYVFDRSLRVPQLRKVNTTNSHAVITGQLTFL